MNFFQYRDAYQDPIYKKRTKGRTPSQFYILKLEQLDRIPHYRQTDDLQALGWTLALEHQWYRSFRIYYKIWPVILDLVDRLKADIKGSAFSTQTLLCNSPDRPKPTDFSPGATLKRYRTPQKDSDYPNRSNGRF